MPRHIPSSVSTWGTYRILVSVILTTLLASYSVITPVAAADPSVERYQVFELTLTTASPPLNPHITTNLTAEFRHEGGYVMNMKGFWDGGGTYKIRFSPPLTGAWTWQTSANDPQLSGKTGALTAVTGNRRGRIKVRADYPRYFQWSNGEPFLMVGDTWWTHFMADWQGQFPESIFNTGVDTRRSQKFNYAHSTVWLDDESSGAITWSMDGQYPFVNGDKDRINPLFFQAMDRRIQYAAEREFVIGMINGWADHNYWGVFSDQQSNQFSQYLINRYAAYPVVWSGLGEYNEGGTPARWDAFADYFRTHDPYRNPVTMHPATPDMAEEERHLDYYIEQEYNDLFNLAVRARTKGVPYVNAEYGYEGNADAVLHNSWRIMMGGAAGIVYGNNRWWQDADTGALESSGTKFIQHLSGFWQSTGIEYWKFTEFNDLGNGRFEAKNNGGQHVYWAETPGSFSINLGDLAGSVPARWYNARNGQWGNAFTMSAGSAVTVTPPDADYALLVGSVNPSPKPGDLNRDGIVDVTDLGILLSAWGATSKSQPDINQDGIVDVVDLGICLSHWTV